MATLKEEAQAYEAPQIKNIADLDKVPIDIPIVTEYAKDNNGTEFKYNAITVDGEKYRVPNKILGDIQAFLKKIPNLKYVSVQRHGEGLKTRYTVIPYES